MSGRLHDESRKARVLATWWCSPSSLEERHFSGLKDNAPPCCAGSLDTLSRWLGRYARMIRAMPAVDRRGLIPAYAPG
jgi:hypothetical protein